MKKLMILVLLMVICLIGKSQVTKPDTLYFFTGKKIPCKILGQKDRMINVLREPDQPAFIESFQIDDVQRYFKDGSIYEPVHAYRTNKDNIDTVRNEVQSAGRMLLKAGNNLIWSDVFYIMGSATGILGAITEKTEMLYLGGAMGVTGLILRFVGNAQTRRSGLILIKGSEKWSVVTDGSSLIVKF